MLHKIENPDTSKIDYKTILEVIASGNTDLNKIFRKCMSPKYLHWNKIKYIPTPDGITPIQLWSIVKLLRNGSLNRHQTFVKDKDNKFFTWDMIPGHDEFLHQCTLELAGPLSIGRKIDDYERKRLVLSGIEEEAIASAQLEGANTTRKAGKKMIREGRKPRTESEQMIQNNYRVMIKLEGDYSETKLDLPFLLELHSQMVEGTIIAEDIGRIRRNKDEIEIVDGRDGKTYHIPPSEEMLDEELPKFIDYFNGKLKSSFFVHPIIKAIIIHFWFAYLHPFVDGNGRLARALFYWYLIKNGYQTFSYMPLSTVIKKSPVQYGEAFVYSEQDDNDLNYFIDYNIRKIKQAKKDFDNYLKKKEEYGNFFLLGKKKFNLRDRELELMRYYHKNPDSSTTIGNHARINQVSRMTAEKDLKNLENIGFLISKKVGRERLYFSTNKINELLD